MINVNNSDVELFRSAQCLDILDNSFVLVRTDDGQGGSAVKKATGAAGEDVVGIAHVSPFAATSRAVAGENHTIDANSKITLKNPGVTAGSVRVFNVTTGAEMAAADYAVAGNVVTWSANAPAATDILAVSYLRSVTLAELAREGLPLDHTNRFQGQGDHCEFATGKSTVHTDFFDTSVAFAIGAPVYISAEGIPTAKSGTKQLGTCERVPTAEYPVLGVSGQWKF